MTCARGSCAVAQQVTDRGDEIAELIVRETGTIRGKADYRGGRGRERLWEAAGLTSRATAEVIPSHNPGKLSLVQRVPVGVVGAILPGTSLRARDGGDRTRDRTGKHGRDQAGPRRRRSPARS